MEWKMPDLGEGVQEGEIVRWLVKEGEAVSIDQSLVEIMTDKATMEIPSSVEGKLQKILLKEGEIAKIGQIMAVIGEEEVGEIEKSEKKEAKVEAKVEKEKEEKEEKEISSQRPLAAPAVRQLARELKTDLMAVRGTGPGGRITKEDVEKASQESVAVKAPSGSEERRPLRGLRRKIAEHMTLSRKKAAHFTHVDEADLTELVLLRESAKEVAQTKGVKLTYLPYIMKALIEGLKKYPSMNASLDEEREEIVLKGYYNLGVAVATEGGLIVPNVKNVDTLSLYDLARETARLGEAAREQKIKLEELKDGTFTITNIGSIGGIFSAPIINYPEVAILGLHEIQTRPVVLEGRIAIRKMMYLSVSADHRVVDGAEVARFLKEVIEILEHPAGFPAFVN